MATDNVDDADLVDYEEQEETTTEVVAEAETTEAKK
jgi:hypothetical protein